MQRLIKTLIILCCGTASKSFATSNSLPATPTALSPCPASPNCVVSNGDAKDQEHHIDPFSLLETPQATFSKIKLAIEAEPRTRIVTQTYHYIRAEFTSLIFRFVDDVEFLYNANAQVAHVRSASRLGYSDLGANRKRIEALREAYKH